MGCGKKSRSPSAGLSGQGLFKEVRKFEVVRTGRRASGRGKVTKSFGGRTDLRITRPRYTGQPPDDC